MPVLYATTNPGKLMEVGKQLAAYGLSLVSPMQLGLMLDVEETGQTLEANATLKAKAYQEQAPHQVIIADDTGVEIDALHGEPGIHVRRWKDHRTAMSDQDIIAYCLERLRGMPPARRGAQFRTVIALQAPGQPLALFEGILRGVIAEQAAPLQYPGFPFETLFYVPEWGKLLGDVHALSIETKRQQGYWTHRERAVQQALPRLREVCDMDKKGTM